jgi:PTH1 family peptidyl-tRNA hydrolase
MVAGLGNPGLRYENTRHNAGFLVVDYICKQNNIKLNLNKFDGVYGYGYLSGSKILFLKPQTFMNKSGECISKMMSYYKIPPEKVILIFDDILLPAGKIRVRRNGTHGGHNGVRNIIDLSSSSQFPRVKVGVGQKPNEDWDLADWVLSKFSKEESDAIEGAVKSAEKTVNLIIDGNIDQAMSLYN